MKKTLSILLSGLLILALCACGSGTGGENSQTSGAEENAGEPSDVSRAAVPAAEPVELVVFAAASLTEPLDEIIDLYRDAAPDVTVVPTYDSSGTLKTQIQEGAECDVFISAAQKQMNQLDAAAGDANPDNLDFVLQGTRRDLLENRVVLTVPADNPRDIQSFADLGTDKLELLCIGNEDVPVGTYSLELLTRMDLLEALEASGKLTYGSNVKEVVAQVAEGTVDAGIVYATDAFSANLTVVDEAGENLVGPVVYPAAVLNITRHEDAARAFLDFLETDAAMDAFRTVGFVPAGREAKMDTGDSAALAESLQELFVGTAGINDGAGVSLRYLRQACNYLAFAEETDYSSIPANQRTEAAFSAFSAMEEEEQAAFLYHFDIIRENMERTFEDPASMEDGYDDAGVLDEMTDLLGQENAQAQWDALSADVQALGSPEDDTDILSTMFPVD